MISLEPAEPAEPTAEPVAESKAEPDLEPAEPVAEAEPEPGEAGEADSHVVAVCDREIPEQAVMSTPPKYILTKLPLQAILPSVQQSTLQHCIVYTKLQYTALQYTAV